MTLVKFIPGDGTEHILEVIYISDYARGKDGTCAFCQGDPCADELKPGPLNPIGQFYENCDWAETCPFCDGRPT